MRNKQTKCWVAGVLLFLLVACAYGVHFYFNVWKPTQQWYHDEEWWRNSDEDDQRTLCHKLISHRLSPDHDAFLHLARIGNVDSLPLLIRALHWQKPAGEGTVTCTIAHCVDALRSLTGEDFGFSPNAWAKWWKETGSTRSPLESR